MSEVLQQQISEDAQYKELSLKELQQAYAYLMEQKQALEVRLIKSEARRRAFIHILTDLNTLNRKLSDQRKAMIHILADYEQERRSLAKQTEQLKNSRRRMHTNQICVWEIAAKL